VAGCALIATLWLAGLGTFQMSRLDTTAELPTQPSFSAYIESVGKKDTGPTGDDGQRDDKAQQDVSTKRFFAHVDKIKANLDAYGSAMGIGYVERQSLNAALLQLLSNDNSDTIDDYLLQLEKFTAQMASQAPAAKKAASRDFRNVSYDAILEWFDGAYRQEAKDAENNSELAAAANSARQTQAKWDLIIAAIFFGIFVLFTMLLVMLQVERNTRISPARQ
jgi:hypothetical protein